LREADDRSAFLPPIFETVRAFAFLAQMISALESPTILDINPVSRSLGERMDYELGVWMLCNQAIRAREEQDVPRKRPRHEDRYGRMTA
jgi:hypothetical protein